MIPEDNPSSVEIADADRTQNRFSSYHGALGEAGVREPMLGLDAAFLANPGEMTAINPPPGGFETVYAGCSWNIQKTKRSGFLGQILGLSKKQKIDIDLGCLVELMDGSRFAIQALGDVHGAYDDPPFVLLSADERTGARDGDDEFLYINGEKWPLVKRVLVYAYIYGGVASWADVRPVMSVFVPGHPPIVLSPRTSVDKLDVCALILFENSRDGMKVTNLSEYFPGQAEMDRAYGFGLSWTQGAKQNTRS